MKTLTTPLVLALLCALPLTPACRELRFEPEPQPSDPKEPDPEEEPEAIPVPRFAAVAVGIDRSCAIDRDGGVLCWGLDLSSSEWGTTDRAPRHVAGMSHASSVAIADDYACAVIAGEGVQCWGHTPLAPVDAVEPQAPFFLSGSSDVKTIAVAPGRVCGVLGSGAVRCWGVMTDVAGCFEPATTAVSAFDLPAVADATTVAVSGSATCFSRADGSAACWLGFDGSLFELPFSDVTRLDIAQSDGCFSAQARFCAVLGAGAIDCVEGFAASELGPVTRLHEADPPAAAIAFPGTADDYCIETAEGSLWCKAAPGGLVIESQAVAVSQTHACALVGEAISCWGSNEWGAIGIDEPARFGDARVVDGLEDATTIATGSDHSCATDAGGALRCWGSNQSGQRGWPSTEQPSVYHPRWSWFSEERSEAPKAVPSLSQADSAFADASRSCASEVDGSVVCWGEDLTFTMSLAEPTVIPDVFAATSIATGDDSQSCAVTAGGVVECWGRGWYGARVGVETVSLPAPAVEVDGDTYSACALLETGEVYCWGGYVEGSVGSAGDPLAPKKMGGIEDAIDLSESCVVTAGHELVCWWFPWLPGAVEQGVPTTVATGVARVDGPCVVRDGGQAACFVDFGALDPAADELLDIAGAEDAVEVAAGTSHACALLADGHVACWGWAAAGRLGDGSRTVYTEPRLIESVLD